MGLGLVYFKVDDFAVACETKELAKKVINDIKELGQIHMFNGVVVVQMRDYVKICNPVYIDKILLRHEWIKFEKPLQEHPIPMRANATYQRELETAEHSDEKKIKELEK